MSTAGSAGVEAPPSAAPGDLLVSGLRRGALLVFLPAFVAGQALAWLTYAASRWYHPWSWFKIGLAETLSSVRVPFSASAPATSSASASQTPGRLVVATGALTIAVLVLAYRAGREQARAFERRPGAAALAGSAVSLGFSLPMLVIAFPVTLGFPQFGIERLEPVLWQAFAMPLVVSGAAGATGGAAVARDALEERVGARVVGAVLGGATALWWGIVGAFVGVLLVAAVSPGPTGAYARFVSRTGGSGAATVIEHASLLPNQSALVLAMSMGSTATLDLGGEPAVRLSRDGIDASQGAGVLLASYAGAAGNSASFPAWFWGFALIPLIATVLGGRAAAGDERRRGERVLRGALGGVVFAAFVVVASWAAGLEIPAYADLTNGGATLGVPLLSTGALALAWGVLGGIVGAALPWPRGVSAGSARPR
jgi:hypothetical protein